MDRKDLLPLLGLLLVALGVLVVVLSASACSSPTLDVPASDRSEMGVTLGQLSAFLARLNGGGIPTQSDMLELRRIQTDWEAIQAEKSQMEAYRTVSTAIFFTVRAVDLAIEGDIDSSRINLEIVAAFMSEASDELATQKGQGSK